MAQNSLAVDSARKFPGAPQTLPRDAPSVRAVRLALAHGALTAADIRLASGLPRRTVYAALRVLEGRGSLGQRGSLHDSRQTFYWLCFDSPAKAADAGARNLSLPGLSLESRPPP